MTHIAAKAGTGKLPGTEPVKRPKYRLCSECDQVWLTGPAKLCEACKAAREPVSSAPSRRPDSHDATESTDIPSELADL